MIQTFLSHKHKTSNFAHQKKKKEAANPNFRQVRQVFVQHPTSPTPRVVRRVSVVQMTSETSQGLQ
jgi:hypothetical protein